MRAQWEEREERHRPSVREIARARSSRFATRSKIAERDYDLNRAAELRTASLPRPRAGGFRRRGWRAPRASGQITAAARRGHRGRDRGDRRTWTGVPVTRLVEGEREKLLRLDEILHERVIGQRRGSAARRRRCPSGPARASRIPDDRSGSFIFLGPTGVGKTELAKTLAETLFDSEEQHRAHRHERVHGEAQSVSA